MRSFRDPDGFVVEQDGRILRCVYPHAASGLKDFLESSVHAALTSEHAVPATWIPGDSGLNETASLVVEHERVAFPNYPFEWSPAMLRAAGLFTLEVAETALGGGYDLKDASTGNVMFSGGKPLFLDLLSFQPLSLDPVWRPYAQFASGFVYPLLAAKYSGASVPGVFLQHRDGLDTDAIWRMLPLHRTLTSRAAFVMVLLAKLFSIKPREGDRYLATPQARDSDEVKFLRRRTFRSLRRAVESIDFSTQVSSASSYEGFDDSYAPGEFTQKQAVIDRVLREVQPERLLDIGCNTGNFSILAANAGVREVVAIDRDAECVNHVYRRGHAAILPLQVDLARPTPATGWENSETSPFLKRALDRKFDAVLALAVLHHLLVTERVPLDALLDLLADLTTKLLVIEYVDPTDVQFRRIARGRDSLHADLNVQMFEQQLTKSNRFRIARKFGVSATRTVYVCLKP
ncbi:50S ribosomal protein L11 methyltransferase [Bryobacterales bacterium F-183]|nr:50S ribosomal protein L11 methyltransferase [Bryobacterales bacterium F-183]